MLQFFKTHPRIVIALELAVILAILQLVRFVFDQISWRYAGPVTLVMILVPIVFFMRLRGISLGKIGLAKITWPKGVLLFLPQVLLAFIAIGFAGVGVALVGETLNIGIFSAEQPDPEIRWGQLYGNTPLYLSWLAILWIAGPAEELFFRGYLISRLTEIFGNGTFRAVLSVILPALIFGLGHVYYQGWRGLFVTGAIGLVLGTLFLVYRKNVWPLMVAHAAFNSMIFTGLYLGADF